MAPTVSYLKPGLAAHRCDQVQVQLHGNDSILLFLLKVGDRLIAVNGVRVDEDSGLSHAQILSLLRNSGDDIVRLELEYDLNGPELAPRNTQPGIARRIADIELREDGTGDEEGIFGFTLRGGAFGPDSGKSRPLTVTAIRPGGAAHREGRLRLGDRLLAINGVIFVILGLFLLFFRVEGFRVRIHSGQCPQPDSLLFSS